MPTRVVTVRLWEIVVAFAAVTIAFVGGLLWIENIASTNHRLIVEQRALSNARIADRRAADRKICIAVNQGRAINNRDRTLLVDSARRTRAAIPKTTGFLHVLLTKSEQATLAQIEVRPYLPPILCARLTGTRKR